MGLICMALKLDHSMRKLTLFACVDEERTIFSTVSTISMKLIMGNNITVK